VAVKTTHKELDEHKKGHDQDIALMKAGRYEWFKKDAELCKAKDVPSREKTPELKEAWLEVELKALRAYALAQMKQDKSFNHSAQRGKDQGLEL